MCGPADFGALHTCVTRLAGLFAVGVTTYAVCRTVSFCRERKLKQQHPKQKTTGEQLPGFALQGSGERSNA
jgi:hypothetical protein